MHVVTDWFIENPVASKILMLVLLMAGFLSFFIISKQFFPAGETNFIRVSVVYPGAGPSEVEKQVLRRIEEAIEELSGIEEIRSFAREAYAEVNIELVASENPVRMLNDVRASVDAITTFPSSAESPQIVELRYKNPIMQLLLSGDVSERELKELGESIREEIAAIPSVMMVEINGTRDYEVSIEIAESRLLQYGLDFSQVANAIRAYSFDLPAGKVSDRSGDIQVQARLQAKDIEDFKKIPLLRSEQGGVVRVADVAVIKDAFTDIDVDSRYQGDRAVEIVVINRDKPQILQTSDAVKEYVARKQQSLPDSIRLEVWTDISVDYRGRLDTLLKNGSSGLLLVFIILVFFLRPVLALWVCLGIVVAFSGAMWVLSLTPITLNVLSMFAFIMILGIIVDDAIIVGEAVHSEQQRLRSYREGAISGVRMVIAPVFFAVVSTIVFFVPFFFLSDSPNTSHMGGPVIIALVFSLVESLILLPSHLASGGFFLRREVYEDAGTRVRSAALERFERFRQGVSDLIPAFANNQYRAFLLKSIAAPKYTLMVFALFFTLSISLVRGGWIPIEFFPRVTSDYVVAVATLPESAAYSQVHELMKRIEVDGETVKEEINQEYERFVVKGIHSAAVGNKATVTMKLSADGNRPISASSIAKVWREQIGEVAGVTDLNVRFTIYDIPKPIAFAVLSNTESQLAAYANDLKQFVATLPGVYDVRSSLEDPVPEINFTLNSNAESLSLTTFDIATQIRQAFYGEEVQQIPRDREDVKVFVRFPEAEREHEERLRYMRISTPSGEQVPLSTLVEFDYRDSFKKIERVDGYRTALISADVELGFSNQDVVKETMAYAQDVLFAKYPAVAVELKGEEQENRDFLAKMARYFVISMLVIFGLMAVMFRSYTQPILVLTAIPFGYMGGVFGHLIVGVPISMLSMLGMLACAGVVVNDNVVLIDRVNQLRRAGYSARRAVVNGAIQRFRPIILTSVTTFLGLTPILLEQSLQAQFLIPMVVSLSFGVLFATTVTLIFVPCLYLLGDSMGRTFRRYISSRRAAALN